MEDGSVQASLKLKDGAQCDPKSFVAVFFKQGVEPNMDRDCYGLDKVGDYLRFSSNKKLDGDYQLHIYKGDVRTSNYQGKVEFKTSDVFDITETGKETGALVKAISKEYGEFAQAKQHLESKTLAIQLPRPATRNQYYWDDSEFKLDNLSYKIVNSKRTICDAVLGFMSLLNEVRPKVSKSE